MHTKMSIVWDTTPYSPPGQLTIRRNISPPSSGSKSKPSKSSATDCFMLSSNLAYSKNPNMEVIYSSETSFNFNRTSWRYTEKDRVLFAITVVRTSTPRHKIYLMWIRLRFYVATVTGSLYYTHCDVSYNISFEFKAKILSLSNAQKEYS
jgi:hypothetical protein